MALTVFQMQMKEHVVVTVAYVFSEQKNNKEKTVPG